MATSSTSSRSPSSDLPDSSRTKSGPRIVELTDDTDAAELATMSISPPDEPRIQALPAIFSVLPVLRDILVTETSEDQDATVDECLPFLTSPPSPLNSHGLPHLAREKHIRFLTRMLEGPFPSYFLGADASRPWFLYWSLTGLYLLGVDLSGYRQRVIDTFLPLQNVDGGFGGGHGQFSHIATSYAAVLSLVHVGGEEALSMIDRRTMWRWLGAMKQPSGGFSMCEGGEVDIRGAYCSMTIIALLNLPMELPPDSPARISGLETFLTGLREWIAACQTYEGGISGAPGNEAHGAYAFCGLACLSIIDAPSRSIAGTLNTDTLIACLASLQDAPLSGFAGRTNKLVDGCYSHWVGGCWPLIDAAAAASSPSPQRPASPTAPQRRRDLSSRPGLASYILSCCQNFKTGGLRDKPSKNPDAYHSCYVLCGLGAAQHVYAFTEREEHELVPGTAGFGWTVEGRADGVPVDEEDVVRAVHPVFVVGFERVEECRRYFQGRDRF